MKSRPLDVRPVLTAILCAPPEVSVWKVLQRFTPVLDALASVSTTRRHMAELSGGACGRSVPLSRFSFRLQAVVDVPPPGAPG